jgi:hypothetical protein
MTNAIFLVEYCITAFDLTVPQAVFEFIFELYNFLAAAKADNDIFHDPGTRLADAKNSVAQKEYSAISKKRKSEESRHNSSPSRRRPARGCARDRDSFDNLSAQRELMSAGYTLTQPISKDLTPLTPVSLDSPRCAR